MEDVHKIKLHYKDDSEEVFGFVDNKDRKVKIVELDEDSKKGYVETGFVPFESVKKIEIKDKIGCIGMGHELKSCKK